MMRFKEAVFSFGKAVVGMSAICVGLVGCGSAEPLIDPALTCAEVDRGEDAPLLTLESGAIEGSDEVVLSGTYRVEGRFIYDGGQEVTIEPGTVFLMEADSRIYVGWRSDPATLYANGTAEAPILFCGTQERAGHWNELQLLGGTTTDSYLDNVRIEDAGGADGSDSPASLLVSPSLRLSNVVVTKSRNVGMDLSGLASDSENLTVTENAGLALRLSGESAISNLPEGEYSGNEIDIAEVAGYSNTNVVFHDRGIPYLQTEERMIFGPAGGPDTSITFEAGVEYRFCQDCLMYIGWRSDPGSIYVRGTIENPVVFTSSQESPSPGDWDGISLLTGTNSDSSIDYAEFRYGGKAELGNLIVDGGRGIVTNSLFADSLGAGILLSDGEDFTVGDGNTFESNAVGDVVEPTP